MRVGGLVQRIDYNRGESFNLDQTSDRMVVVFLVYTSTITHVLSCHIVGSVVCHRSNDDFGSKRVVNARCLEKVGSYLYA
jgi:hypothetical protein